MKSWMVGIGVIVVLVLVINNGIIGGAMCIRGIGCAYSTGNGLKVDNSQSVQVALPGR